MPMSGDTYGNVNSIEAQFHTTGSGLTNAANTPAGSILVGVWYHIVITSDGIGNVSKIYINGLSQALSGGWGFLDPTATNTFEIGYKTSATARMYNGAIDELRIYDKVLTDSEVRALYSGYDPGEY
jgi:hypothetical protein